MKGLGYAHWLILVVFVAQSAGCVHSERNLHLEHMKTLAAQYETWSAASKQTYDSARYFKPNTESASVSALALEFAPLVVQEAGGMSSYGDAGEENSSPAMIVDIKRVGMGDSDYDQITYQWLVSKKVRGLRITVGQDGFAAAIEVIQPGASHRRVFVSKSMEAAARAAYGEPLAGRRYAVEPTIESAPHVLVVGTFGDGPIPMGPFVYVNAAIDVAAIRCRCSDSLVDAFSQESVYELLPIDAMPRHDGGTKYQAATSIVQKLRWPSGF